MVNSRSGLAAQNTTLVPEIAGDTPLTIFLRCSLEINQGVILP
jgi:hypothetical protein